jgi:protein TonB
MARLLSLSLSGLLHAGTAGAALFLGLGVSYRLPEVPVSLPPSTPMALDLTEPVIEAEFARPDPAAPAALPEDVRVEFEPEREVPEPADPEPPRTRPERPVPPLDRPLTFAVARERRVPPPVPQVETEASAVEIYNPPPDYPPQARRRGLEGEALVEIAVLPDGACGGARVLECSGSSLFGEAALAAVRAWRYKPAVRNGQAVAAVVPVRFVFRLRA